MNRAQSQHVLLVEGDAHDLELLQYIFARYSSPFGVRIAPDGEEALRRFFGDGDYSRVPHSKLPGLIMINSRLPKISGLEVLRRLKSNALTSTIPVVMLVASAEDYEIQQGYAAGLDGHIEQQIDFRRFAEKVQSTCQWWLGLEDVPETSSSLWSSPSGLTLSLPSSP